MLLTALLAAESNRPSIDYIGAARGSLHPALLLTLVMPDVFGASGRMEDYWGPPSFAWPDTGIFLAQNMGQLYIGAHPAAAAALAAVRGQLWAPRDPLLHLRRRCRAGLCARLVHARVPRPLRAVPGVDLYRRPADATFLIGALGAILAGYGAHRLLTEPPRGCRAACASLAARPRLASCWPSAWGSGSVGCRGFRFRSAAALSRLPPRLLR